VPPGPRGRAARRERLPDPREQLEDAERVAAHLEEVVVEPHLFDPEHLAEQVGEPELEELVGRRAVRRRDGGGGGGSVARSILCRTVRGSRSTATNAAGTIVVGTRVATSRRSRHALSGTEPSGTT